MMSMTFPVTHDVDNYPCISRYPVDEWERDNSLGLTTKCWCQLCRRICAFDMENLEAMRAEAMPDVE